MIEHTPAAAGKAGRILYLSSSCVRSESVAGAVERLSAITPNIELSGGTSYDKELLERLKKIKKERDIRFLIHGYFPPPKEGFVLNFADTGARTREFIRESMRYAASLGAKYYSIHAGFKRDFDFRDESLMDTGKDCLYGIDGIVLNIEWFRSEFPGAGLAVENLFPNGGNAECCFLMHIEDIVAFLNRMKDASLLLDLGHLQVSARFFGFGFTDAAELLLGNYAERIAEIHLSENDGDFDGHGLIHEGSVQLEILKKHAAGILGNGINLVIEARNARLEELEKCYNLVYEKVFAAK